MACMRVCQSAEEIPQKITNESQAVGWRPAQTAVDQSVPTHCKSHTPQVGTRKGVCMGPVPHSLCYSFGATISQGAGGRRLK